jgi:nicotinamide mononucleotide adenylyltransferase
MRFIILLLCKNYINSLLNDKSGTINENLPAWIPPNIKKNKGEKIQIKLLCGADLLQSFSVPGLWADEDVRLS